MAIGIVVWFWFEPVRRSQNIPPPNRKAVGEIGVITGKIGFPGGGLPDQVVCAEKRSQLRDRHCVAVAGSSSVNTFTLPVPPGDYVVYAFLGDSTDLDPTEEKKAHYSQFVTCGLKVGCANHEPIVITVETNRQYTNINPIDWYRADLNPRSTISTCKDEPGGHPVITFLSRSSGPRGTQLEIRGCNLSGFEGDLDVYFERSDGKKITLTDTFGSYAKTSGSLIKVVVKEPCQQGETVYGRGSGIPTQCDYAALTPGLYKIYTEPWGKRSNTVYFTIQ